MVWSVSDAVRFLTLSRAFKLGSRLRGEVEIRNDAASREVANGKETKVHCVSTSWFVVELRL